MEVVEEVDLVLAPSLDNLPDLALLNILKYLDISVKKILRLSNKCLERRVTGSDRRLRHWHVPIIDFLNSSKYNKLCSEIERVKEVFPERYENITIGLDLNVQGEVGNLRLQDDGQYGLELLLLSAEKLSYINICSYSCKILKHLSNKNITLPLLETLSLYEISDNEREDIEQLSHRIESLDVLKLEACSFKDCFLLQHCAQLQQLFLTDVEVGVISGYVSNCAATLETLEIVNPDSWLKVHILSRCKVLQRLSLEFEEPIAEQESLKLYEILKNLFKSLIFLLISNLAVKQVELNQFTKLRVLSISCSPDILISLSIPTLVEFTCRIGEDTGVNRMIDSSTVKLDTNLPKLKSLILVNTNSFTRKLKVLGAEHTLAQCSQSLQYLGLCDLYFETSLPLPQMIALEKICLKHINMNSELTRSFLCSQKIEVIQLVDVELHVPSLVVNFCNIIKLDLTFQKQINHPQIFALLSKCFTAKLISLKLRYNSYGPPLEIDSLPLLLSSVDQNLVVLNLYRIKVEYFPAKFSRLTELEVEDVDLTDETFAQLLSKCCDTLQYLHADLRGVNLSSQFNFLLPSLKYVHLSEVVFSKDGLVGLFESCMSSLEMLTLANIELNDDLNCIACCPPNLETIYLDPDVCKKFRKLCIDPTLRQIFDENNLNL